MHQSAEPDDKHLPKQGEKSETKQEEVVLVTSGQQPAGVALLLGREEAEAQHHKLETCGFSQSV